MPPNTDSAAAAIAVISTNMLQQIIALQEVINSREPQQRFPTMQEAGLLTKMITALEKLKRFLAPPKQPSTERVTARNKRNKQAETAASEVSGNAQFAADEETPASRTKSNNKPANETPVPQIAADGYDPLIPSLQKALATFDPEDVRFPIEEHEFSDYQHLFDNMRSDERHTTMVKGYEYNTNWLQYNLYQYCLPLHERRFFYNEARYHQRIGHENVMWLIGEYLRRKR